MSTEPYMPTTEQMRGAWVRNVLGDPEAAPTRVRAEVAAEFDRWLAAHDAELAERIAQAIEELEHTRADISRHVREEGVMIDHCQGHDEAVAKAARIAREIGSRR